MNQVKTYGRDQIVGIINSVLGKIQAPSEEIQNQLVHELEELKASMEALAAQLHSSRVSDISETHIPTATDELFAVVEATEQATHTIMEACEKILETVKDADPELFKKIETHTVAIFEACTFQDITGQRIKKVTCNLKEIDEKTVSVLGLLHSNGTGGQSASPQSEGVVSLLNGPGLPGNSLSQDDIDKMLSEFDNPDS